MLAIDALLFGWVGLVIFAVQMLWIPFWAAGVINGIGHYWGYRNFETPDASRNIIPFGVIVGGEELHNNHHAYRQSARLSNKWWEIDLGWAYIRLLEMVGLASVNRTAPKTDFVPTKRAVDLDTVKARFFSTLSCIKKFFDQYLYFLSGHFSWLVQMWIGQLIFRQGRGGNWLDTGPALGVPRSRVE